MSGSRQAKSQTFGIRLSEDERAELQRRAGEMAVGAYINRHNSEPMRPIS